MPELGELLAAVDGSRLEAHLAEFAKRVKLSGTEEELESFRYLEAEMRRLGYRTRLERHDAYISLPGKARLSVGGESHAVITHSFSRATGPAGLAAPVVDVGAGSEEAFAAADVRGRIVLVDGLAAPAVTLKASEAGAVGQIHVMAAEHIHEMCISPVWGSPAADEIDRLPKTVVVSLARADGERIRARLADGPLEATIHAEVDTGWRKIPLLEADLSGPGDDPATEPFILLSGHHDTWYHGVMDNGAANAVMLEVARILAAHRADWRRGLRVCFWSGHSHGRYAGSAYYADTRWQALERRCLVHVNVDSTGGRGNTVLTDMVASAELRPLAAEVVRATGGQDLDGHRPSRAGDQSFWGIGVPSLFMAAGEQPAGAGYNPTAAILGGHQRKGAGFGWWWHTPDDTLDKIDLDLEVRDTQVYLHALWRLLTAPVVPLDHREYAADLSRSIAAFGDLSAHGIELNDVRERAAGLKERAEALAARIADVRSEAEAEAMNDALRRICRHLVPLDYTSGDRFDHDPALGQPPFPLLDPVRRLAESEAGTDEARFRKVAARRALNRLTEGLDKAIRTIDRSLERPDAHA